MRALAVPMTYRKAKATRLFFFFPEDIPTQQHREKVKTFWPKHMVITHLKIHQLLILANQRICRPLRC